jgi:phenylacetate-coenzyme A ligase PaaK-like adenylate-forming protein
VGLADRIYQNAPNCLQTVLLNAYAFRLRLRRSGRQFRAVQAEWDASERWDSDRLREYQNARLQELIKFAYARVPFYRRHWDAHGVRVAQVQGIADLPMLPVITKSDIRSAGDEMLRDGTRHGLFHGHTSGTTGSPLSLWYDRDMVVVNNVAHWRQRRWAGCEQTDWCALFLGRVVVPTDRTEPPFWRADYAERHLWCSSFHLSEENLHLYVRELRKRRIRFIEGYPSTLFILARHLLRQGQTLPMTAVFTSSETLHAVQREAMIAAFQAPAYDFYGSAERVIFAAECDEHEGKHLFDEYGITEVTEPNGTPVAPGARGLLTGTSLWNHGMPMIRYQTSDVTRLLAEPCACGRGLGRMANITTKAEDIIITPDGRFISPSVLTHPFKPFDQILKSQVVQDAADHVTVSIVASASFTPEQCAELENGLRVRLGERMRVETRLVDDIPPEASGKFRWVVCRVAHDRSVDWEAAEA